METTLSKIHRMDKVRVGILTVSDSCSRGQSKDVSGDKLAEYVAEKFGHGGWKVTDRLCVADDKSAIMDVLIRWSDHQKLNLILTTGGTGFSPRDVTPEATKAVLEKEAPGLVLAMLSNSLKVTPMAMVSRPAAGIRKKTLIVNLPGSSKGCVECLSFICDPLPHALDVISDDIECVTKTHAKLHGGHTCGGHHQPPSDVSGVQITDPLKIAQRPRQSPFPMISVTEAQEKVLEHCELIGTETVSFKDSLGRVLAHDVFAKDALPPFPASIKDGYAVVSSDGAGYRPVFGDSTAGCQPGAQILPGQCVRINTGAPVPQGADAVVQVEDTKLIRASEDGKTELEIEILKAPIRGQDIRPVGSDIEAGSKVLSAGMRIGAAEVGLLAAVGALEVTVYKLPKVALLSTGDEIQDPSDGANLAPGFIRDSNKATLESLIAGEHHFVIVDCGIARDHLGNLSDKMKEALTVGDLVVTTGGVSMGDRDLLRHVLVKDFGADIHFGRVNMKPGKPTTFATLNWQGKKKLILGLPGNPVSATVTAHLYVLPACRKMAGFKQHFSSRVRARLSQSVSLDPRPEYQRVVLSWTPGESVADTLSTGNQISSRLLSFQGANGLLMLPPATADRQTIQAGDVVDAMIVGQLFGEF